MIFCFCCYVFADIYAIFRLRRFCRFTPLLLRHAAAIRHGWYAFSMLMKIDTLMLLLYFRRYYYGRRLFIIIDVADADAYAADTLLITLMMLHLMIRQMPLPLPRVIRYAALLIIFAAIAYVSWRCHAPCRY